MNFRKIYYLPQTIFIKHNLPQLYLDTSFSIKATRLFKFKILRRIPRPKPVTIKSTTRRTAYFRSIERFHSRDYRPYWFTETKESICIKIEFISPRFSLGLQHGRHFFALGHQHGRRFSYLGGVQFSELMSARKI